MSDLIGKRLLVFLTAFAHAYTFAWFGYRLYSIPGAAVGLFTGGVVNILAIRSLDRWWEDGEVWGIIESAAYLSVLFIVDILVGVGMPHGIQISLGSVSIAFVLSMLPIWFGRDRLAKKFGMDENPDEYIKYKTREARLMHAKGRGVTRYDFELILTKYGHKCLRCGDNEHLCMDHVVPLVLGGHHDPTNIQPLCKHCNTSKGGHYADYRDWEHPEI